MNRTRRKFLKFLFSTPFAAFAAKTVTAGTVPKHYPMNKFFVAGFRFYNGPKLIPKLKEGKKLTLCAEPQNRYDKYAVQILHKNTMLGYVPRSDNRHVSRLLRKGIPLDCRVIETNMDENPWRMLRVEVYLISNKEGTKGA